MIIERCYLCHKHSVLNLFGNNCLLLIIDQALKNNFPRYRVLANVLSYSELHISVLHSEIQKTCIFIYFLNAVLCLVISLKCNCQTEKLGKSVTIKHDMTWNLSWMQGHCVWLFFLPGVEWSSEHTMFVIDSIVAIVIFFTKHFIPHS